MSKIQGLDMRNLESEIRISIKIRLKSQWQNQKCIRSFETVFTKINYKPEIRLTENTNVIHTVIISQGLNETVAKAGFSGTDGAFVLFPARKANYCD